MSERRDTWQVEYERLRERYADAYLAWHDANRRTDLRGHDAACHAVVKARQALDAHVLGRGASEVGSGEQPRDGAGVDPPEKT